jgi:flagellar protein FliO/FliZ
VLVRRDNVEHLLMIGGPSDVVIEQNILRAVPVTPPRDVPVPRGPSAADAPPVRPEPVRAPAFEEEEPWPPQPEPPLRPAAERPPFPRLETPPRVPRSVEPRPIEPRPIEPRPMEPREPRIVEPRVMESRAPEPRIIEPRPLEPRSAEPRPVEPRPIPDLVMRQPQAARTEPPPIVPAAEPALDAEPRAGGQPDAALASMAQRLEAALRRPTGAEASSNEPSPRAPAERSEAGPVETAAAQAFRSGWQDEPSDVVPSPPTAAPEVPSAQTQRPEPKSTKPKTVLDSLEEEMASLLGRPGGKE